MHDQRDLLYAWSGAIQANLDYRKYKKSMHLFGLRLFTCAEKVFSARSVGLDEDESHNIRRGRINQIKQWRKTGLEKTCSRQVSPR
jgi:hypothetical protein